MAIPTNPHDKPLLSDARFVRAWCRSKSIQEMITETGLGRGWIYARARSLRKRGVKLPYWSPYHNRPPVEDLNRLVDVTERG